VSQSFDPRQLLQQAQDLSAKLRRVQEDLRHRTVEASVGGGIVAATANGRGELVAVRIDPVAVDPRDVEMLQDLVLAAVNEALRRAQELARDEMQRATGLPLSLLGALAGNE
jgi:DNA-binding YbaB/EbfC family protein